MNNRKKNNWGCLACIAFILFTISTTYAGMISINNPGFESNTLGNGGFIFAADDWVGTGNFGTQNPLSSWFTNEAPEGENTAFLNHDGSTLSQVLSTSLVANTQYTLNVELGDRLDAVFINYQVQLLAGSTLLAEDNNSLSPPEGGFITSTVSFLSDSSNSLIGSPLEIRFIHTGGNGQINFDDVRLEAVSVIIPEPSTYALFIIALSGLGVVRQKRKSQIV